MKPTVSFVVPCYKLAHLLGECIDSIISQTYEDFEVLILDDCSPDNTSEVARSYAGPRVRYIRNEINLKHLKNYNKGISLARGEYIWLISADDCLRRPHALERYVRFMGAHPNVGYVFSPGIGLLNGQETRVLDYSVHGVRDTVFGGRQFLAQRLIYENTIVAASGLVRRQAYEKVGLFPLDMPWGGDWYLWCAFAFYFDVGYIAEPLVCYRQHQCSMTNILMENNIGACYSDDIRIPWIIKAKADGETGCEWLAEACLRSVAREYARRLAGKHYKTAATYTSMTLEQFEDSLRVHSTDAAERKWVRARVYAYFADHCQDRGDLGLAREFYFKALREDPGMAKIWGKGLLAACGKPGLRVRQSIPALRRAVGM